MLLQIKADHVITNRGTELLQIKTYLLQIGVALQIKAIITYQCNTNTDTISQSLPLNIRILNQTQRL